ncbi:MAG: hypothetical protein MHM6MM_007812, partial [Cercozoa sp. M6MM]
MKLLSFGELSQYERRHLILQYVFTKPPGFDEKKNAATCHHCKAPLGKFARQHARKERLSPQAAKNALKWSTSHNCRLCGHVFCDRCAPALHLVPSTHCRRRKSVGRPVPVCFGCRDSCLLRRLSPNSPIAWICARPRQVSVFIDMKETKERYLLVFPPDFAAKSAYSQCITCGSSFGLSFGRIRSRHHCRLCGEMACSNCVSKMLLPRAYCQHTSSKAGSSSVSSTSTLSSAGDSGSSDVLMDTNDIDLNEQLDTTTSWHVSNQGRAVPPVHTVYEEEVDAEQCVGTLVDLRMQQEPVSVCHH